MAPKRQRAQKPNFSKWARQDEKKASAREPPRYFGAQSLASIATGRDGSVVVKNAGARGVTFEPLWRASRGPRASCRPRPRRGKVAELFLPDAARALGPLVPRAARRRWSPQWTYPLCHGAWYPGALYGAPWAPAASFVGAPALSPRPR